MEFRKLIKFGESSHVVSLPSLWVKKNKLKKGDLIYLDENGNNELVLLPSSERENRDAPRDTIIKAENKDVALIKRELVSCYLNGFNKISIVGKDLSKYKKPIRKLVNTLMALEIIEENSEKIVFKDFLKFEKVDVYDIIKKMDIIVRVMMDEIKIGSKIDAEDFEYKFLDVVKLYFLYLRLVRTASDRPYLLKHLGAKLSDVFKVRHVASNLETIADQIHYIAVELTKTNLNSKDKKLLAELFDKLRKIYLDVMKAYYKEDMALAYKLSEAKEEIFNDVESVLDEIKNVRAAVVAEKMKNLSRSVHRIIRRTYG